MSSQNTLKFEKHINYTSRYTGHSFVKSDKAYSMERMLHPTKYAQLNRWQLSIEKPCYEKILSGPSFTCIKKVDFKIPSDLNIFRGETK